ncbi:hypothetical protein Q5692_24820 [Microcoleus sp. C2C3]
MDAEVGGKKEEIRGSTFERSSATSRRSGFNGWMLRFERGKKRGWAKKNE